MVSNPRVEISPLAEGGGKPVRHVPRDITVKIVPARSEFDFQLPAGNVIISVADHTGRHGETTP